MPDEEPAPSTPSSTHPSPPPPPLPASQPPSPSLQARSTPSGLPHRSAEAIGERLDLDLPPSLDCAACLEALHVRLHAIPGVRLVTLSSKSHTVSIELEPGAAGTGLRALAQAAVDGLVGAEHPRHARNAAAPEPLPVMQVAAPPRASAQASDHGHDAHDGAGHAHGVGGHREMALRNRRRLLVVVVAGSAVMVTEIVGGIYANSLVLLADAGHYATDIASVLLALLALQWALKPPTVRKTFGYQRAEVLSALVQATALWGISAFFLYEAYRRIRTPPDVEGPVVLAIGLVTLAVNLVLALVLRGGGPNINMRAAYLHILSDVLGSAAAVVAGALILLGGYELADPLLTVFITLLILVFTWKLTKQSLHILMEGTPIHAEGAAVEDALRGVPGVKDVHDLHIWTHTPGMDSLTAHIVVDQEHVDDGVTQAIQEIIRSGFSIHHITIQVERPGFPCKTLHHRWERGT